jgi:hypothetical protein
LYTCFRRPALHLPSAGKRHRQPLAMFKNSSSNLHRLVESWSVVERLSWQEKQSACVPERKHSAPHADELTSACQETGEMQKGTGIPSEP